jgi:adenylate cyclase
MSNFQPPHGLSWFSNSEKLKTALLGFGGIVICTSVLVTGLVATLRAVGAMEGIELSAYDTLMRIRPEPGPDDRLLVVGISEEDIQTRKEFPIQDGTLAQLLTLLEAKQPRVIALDIARDVPQGTGRDQLVQVMQSSDRILSGCKLSSETEPGIGPAPGVPRDRTAFADLPQDDKGMIRRSILLSTPAPSRLPPPESHICNEVNPENQLPSIALAVALRYLAQQGIEPRLTDAGEIQLGDTVLHRLGEQAGAYQHTGATDYQILLNYRSGDNAVRVVSLSDVLEGRVEHDWIKDRAVLIGYTSSIAKDVFFTPFSAGDRDDLAMPGVVIHAQATSQILSAVLEGRSLIGYGSFGLDALWILTWATVGGLVAWAVQKPLWFILGQAGVIVSLLAACYLLFLVGFWVPLVPAAVALVASAGSVVMIDRANRGGYTQAVYQQFKEQVQGALKPKIEIDQAKREQEVSEIVESSYFQDLQARARAIREQRAAKEQHNPEK